MASRVDACPSTARREGARGTAAGETTQAMSPRPPIATTAGSGRPWAKNTSPSTSPTPPTAAESSQAPTRLRGTSPPVIRCREPWITTKVDYICRSPPGGGDRLGAGGHRASLTVGAPQGDGLPVPSVCDGRYLSTP